MTYKFIFSHRRNHGYMFIFESKANIYEFSFTYLPLYEIIIYKCRQVETLKPIKTTDRKSIEYKNNQIKTNTYNHLFMEIGDTEIIKNHTKDANLYDFKKYRVKELNFLEASNNKEIERAQKLNFIETDRKVFDDFSNKIIGNDNSIDLNKKKFESYEQIKANELKEFNDKIVDRGNTSINNLCNYNDIETDDKLFNEINDKVTNFLPLSAKVNKQQLAENKSKFLFQVEDKGTKTNSQEININNKLIGAEKAKHIFDDYSNDNVNIEGLEILSIKNKYLEKYGKNFFDIPEPIVNQGSKEIFILKQLNHLEQDLPEVDKIYKDIAIEFVQEIYNNIPIKNSEKTKNIEINVNHYKGGETDVIELLDGSRKIYYDAEMKYREADATNKNNSIEFSAGQSRKSDDNKFVEFKQKDTTKYDLKEINLKSKEIKQDGLNNVEFSISDELYEQDLNFINLGKCEVDKNEIKNIELSKDSELYEQDLDFINLGKREVDKNTINNVELYEKDNELFEEDPTLVNIGKLEIDFEKIHKHLEDYVANSEIFEEDLDFVKLGIREIAKEKIKNIEKNNNIDIDVNDIKEIEFLPIETKSDNLTNLEFVGTKEILKDNSYNNTETGARRYDFRLKNDWAQDWIHLTYQKTLLGKLIDKKKEALQDFNDLMRRVIRTYSFPTTKQELEHFLNLWINNTYIDYEYIDAIQDLKLLMLRDLEYNKTYSVDDITYYYNKTRQLFESFFIKGFSEEDLCMGHEEVRIRLKAMLVFFLFLEQLIDNNKGYLRGANVVDAVNLISKTLWKWWETESGYYEPTDEDKEKIDKNILSKLKENLPIDYKFLIRWFDWYSDKEIFLNDYKGKTDGFTALCNIRDSMISYFNTHWGVRKTNYDELKEQTDNKELLEKPAILVDKSVVDKIRGLKHGLYTQREKPSSKRKEIRKIGWSAINKEDKNKPLSYDITSGINKGNLKDSYNIDLHDLIYEIYKKEIYQE